ncbi:hypothetical protein C5L38_34520 (plasmid) [Streptomyces sp. WAC00288]|uniref:hypothetical protein n=1 Tax=unclassified Streptomyces TaxID=2593676 RepID=UPI000786DD0D|nr:MULTISPECIES: hypothetical protein [unclassified Streptomyces]AVI00036.1 hypothetical protein C5L38_33690 [Streptomyces sp. WAC00288]AVI00180.1 hypothetical protein C5L38_34520 [Streptomyces sp. WAC00288]KYG51100.1 hypothetical protein AWI43_32115 [Streptomyces sp. WAC04657]
MPPTRASRPQLPSALQFLLAPRVMRHIAIFQLDHGLDFQDARRWCLAAQLYRWHLEHQYGPRWKRRAPAAEAVAASWYHFHPDRVPEGPGRDLVRAVLDVTAHWSPGAAGRPGIAPPREDRAEASSEEALPRAGGDL